MKCLLPLPWPGPCGTPSGCGVCPRPAELPGTPCTSRPRSVATPLAFKQCGLNVVNNITDFRKNYLHIIRILLVEA